MHAFVRTVVFIALAQLSAASADEKRLYRAIFDDYLVSIRPRLNSSEAIVVTLNLELNQLKEIEEKGQIQRAVVMLEAEWRDDYLTWNPEDYNNITEIVVPPSSVWLPDFGIQNSVGTFYQDTFYDYFRVHVGYSGRIIWSFGGLFETSCSIDTTIYPFDSQSCSIVVENWAYNKEAVALINGSSGVRLDNYLCNGLWDYLGSSVAARDIQFQMHPGVLYPQMEFVIQWKRKPQYYLVNVMVPCVFLLSIALLVFWLPPDAGEKVSLGVTVLLAFSVFQLVIADNTPENSDNTPLLSLFVSLTMALSTVSVVTTIFVLYLHHKSPTSRVPRWIKFIFYKILSRILCMSADVEGKEHNQKSYGRNNGRSAGDDDQRKQRGEDGFPADESIELALTKGGDLKQSRPVINDSALRCLSEQIDVVTELLKSMTSRIADREHEARLVREWQMVAKVIDRLLFWIVIFVLGVSCAWMLSHVHKNTGAELESTGRSGCALGSESTAE